MKKFNYDELQDMIDNLYETTKYKDYTSSEKEGAKKFALAIKSKLKSLNDKENNINSFEKVLPELIDEYIKCYDFLNKWDVLEEHTETEKEAFNIIKMVIQTLPYLIENIKNNN